MKHITKNILSVGMLFAVIMMAAQTTHAQTFAPSLQAQLKAAQRQISEIRTQLGAVDEQIRDEMATVAELAAAVKGGNSKKVAFLLDQSEQRANAIEKTISEISNSVDTVRKTLQKIAAAAAATNSKKIFTDAQRMLDVVDNGLVPRLEQSTQDLQDLRDSIQKVRGQLGTVT